MTPGVRAGPRMRGRADAAGYLREPRGLRELPLSRYCVGPTVPRLLRAAMLRLPLGAALAALLRAAGPGRAARRVGEDVLYWIGAREALGAGEAWEMLRWSGVPVLLYHRIVDGTDRRDPKYALPSRQFRAHLRLLRRLGYRSLPLDELVEAHRAGIVLPPRRVVITFDDGYADNRTAAALLREHGLAGAIFVVTDDLGGVARWRLGEIGPVPMLTWPDLRRLATEGIEIGGHSRVHPNLAALPAAAARREIRGSLDALRRELGGKGYAFAYPHGMATEETRRLVAEAGYVASFGTRRGLSTMHDDLLDVRRIQVYGDEGLLTFWIRLTLGDTPLDYLPWGRLGRRRRDR